jgi:hypothetical protein
MIPLFKFLVPTCIELDKEGGREEWCSVLSWCMEALVGRLLRNLCFVSSSYLLTLPFLQPTSSLTALVIFIN